MKNEKFKSDPNTATLEDAKTWLRERLSDGADCPCCNQFTKLYVRSFLATMAYTLIQLNRASREGTPWIHIQEMLTKARAPSSIASSGDYAKMRFWGLIEPCPERREDGSKRNGYWRITDAGRAFVEGKTAIPSHVLVFGDTFLGTSGPPVTVREALGKKFNYTELMGVA